MNWTEQFDMSTVPDTVLRSEWARRSARKRKTYSGGVIWKAHNPNHKACRCKRCMKRRHATAGGAK